VVTDYRSQREVDREADEEGRAEAEVEARLEAARLDAKQVFASPRVFKSKNIPSIHPTFVASGCPLFFKPLPFFFF
jgi:hypothetical protein